MPMVRPQMDLGAFPMRNLRIPGGIPAGFPDAFLGLSAPPVMVPQEKSHFEPPPNLEDPLRPNQLPGWPASGGLP